MVILVSGMLRFGCTENIQRCSRKCLRYGFEAQVDVLSWRQQLEIHQNMGSISRTAWMALFKEKG